MTGPALAVVIAADCFETIRQTVRHLAGQSVCAQIELVMVTEAAGSFGIDAAATSGFHRVMVVEVPSLFPLSLATSAGVKRATAPVVVLAESHAFPSLDWAQVLIEAHRGPGLRWVQ